MLGATAGLACRMGGGWKVPVLAQGVRAPAADGEYRQAGSEMPAAVLEAIDAAPSAARPLDASAAAPKQAGATNALWT
jgi:hypothetical protein